MISNALRILLICGSLFTLGFMLSRIRASKVQIRDTIFWIIFSGILFILSLFPQITTMLSIFLGIQSQINFVYLFIIFILMVKLFSATLHISSMDAKIQQLVQRLALYEKQAEDDNSENSDTSS